MLSRRQKEFLQVLQAVLDSVAGQKLFKYLYDDYVIASALDRASVENTYYRLGQKELVQGLLHDAKLTEGDLESINIANINED